MKQCSSCGGFCGKVCQRKNEDDDIQVYQRPWVDLTDGEVDEVHGSPMSLEHSGLLGFVRAIEDALRKKNI